MTSSPNIAITEGGSAKVLDFGIAKREMVDAAAAAARPTSQGFSRIEAAGAARGQQCGGNSDENHAQQVARRIR